MKRAGGDEILDCEEDVVDNAKRLASVERLLGQMKEMCCCPICFDFYHAPVMFPKCGHTFCSLCIRQALMFKDECPSCRIEARTNDLVPVKIVEGLSTLCRKITDRAEDQAQRESVVIDGRVASLGIDNRTRSESPRPRKRRRKTGSSPEEVEEQFECPECKIKVLAANFEKHKSVCPGKEEGWVELGRVAAAAAAEKAKISGRAEGVEYPKKRLPLLAYSVLNDKVLRKKCEEYKLPSKGSRALREKRLKEYINRYNAECDSDNPKTVQEIIDDVISAENEYKQATKPKKEKEMAQPKITFQKLYEAVKSRKPEQQKEPDECDSQQTQLSYFADGDLWDFNMQNQSADEKDDNNNVDDVSNRIDGGEEEEEDNGEDTFYTQLN